MREMAPGREALAQMDAVLARKPEKDGHALAQATRCLAEYRDAITPADLGRAPPPERERLGRVNAILSLVMALHFPIGEPPWDDFQAARDWLAGLLEGAPPPAATRA